MKCVIKIQVVVKMIEMEHKMQVGYVVQNIGWTISSSSRVYWANIIYESGYLSIGTINGSAPTTPVVYLKPNVKIKSGDGTIDNPYEFEL